MSSSEPDSPVEVPAVPASPDGAAPALLEGRFTGREAFRQLVRDALAAAAREGWREIILSDANYEDWPLNERTVSDSLHAWAKTGRTFTLMARNYDDLRRRQDRFVAWRVRWSHIVSAWACPSAQPLEFPSVIWTPGWVLEQRDTENHVGQCGSEARRRLRSREALNEWLKKSSPGLPASVLGL